MDERRSRIAVVTGASRGIGPRIARSLVRAGTDVALVARDRTQLAAVATGLADGPGRTLVVPADLCAPGAVDATVRQVVDAFGRIDLLVHNAGIETLGSLTELPPDQLARTIELNLTVPLLLTRAALPPMLDRADGHVVFVSSLMGKAGAAYHAAYSASKAGLVGMTQSLRQEYAGSGVGFSVVCPGLVRDVGMYADMGGARGRAPRLLGTVTADQVAAAVMTVIANDEPERIVTGTPVRPLLALAAVAPRLMDRLTRAFGVTEMYRDGAERAGTARR